MTKYSNELKAKVVSEYLKGGIGYRELSVRYGIPSRANIRTWVNQARTHGIESLKVQTTTRLRIRRPLKTLT
ncbi:helix-turn-helix domain-containing protein [Lacticaseibacillus paracasei]|uniref:helix-turn-helix domain-containing protein n=1 Tax=Lacticaseibacillus paracasei TaxID=1597 RepID=UPI0012FE960A|nr:helix-turn-helix domain-containing protein [Lacticaseibacillus paracasei]